MTATPWILATSAPHPLGFRCLRCGHSLNLQPPVSVGDYLTAGKGFVATHALCVAPEQSAQGGEQAS